MTATYATLDALRSNLGTSPAQHSPEYVAKMLHSIPETTEVTRETFLLERCAGKRVLEFGASGPMHTALVRVAAALTGVDRCDGDGVIGFDLDDIRRSDLPVMSDPDVIVCGELLEHLSNPGWFLTRLRQQYVGVMTLLTTPNAYSAVGRSHLTHGRENVNIDHVCWFSPRTLRTLLERHGYVIREFYYYGGLGPTASGLVVVTD